MRAQRRAERLPRETTEPRRRYVVPRHTWPAALQQLTEARASFLTGVGLPAPGPGLAAPVEVFVAERGAAILERIGGRQAGTGRDPWQARMREFERLQREAANRAQRDAGAADAFEKAFQREAERVRVMRSEAGEP